MERTTTGYEMTPVERGRFDRIVELCGRGCHNLINVAGPDESDALVAAQRHMIALETENQLLRAERDDVIPGPADRGVLVSPI